MANTDIEKNTYGLFERFLYFFLIPLLFTSILTAALLMLLGYDLKNSFLKVGHSIPVIGKMIPAPQDKSELLDGTLSSSSQADRIVTLAAAVAEKDAEIIRMQGDIRRKDEQIAQMHTDIEQLQSLLEGKTLTDEEYELQIKEIASLYSTMSAGKAAPILENLSMPELVLLLHAMNVTERSKILEKMNPKTAAEASILMKDVVPVKDLEIAALQSRLELYEQVEQPNRLADTDLALTFTEMAPKSAATILNEMISTDENKVILLLSLMSNQSRAQILAAISDLSTTNAARLTAKLG